VLNRLHLDLELEQLVRFPLQILVQMNSDLEGKRETELL
jgi:hypothetical protein